MAEYYAQVYGQYSASVPWSFGRRITSGQTPSALLTTWSNAWIAAWNDAVHGLKVIYPTTTIMESYSIATVNGIYEQTAKVQLATAEPGTAAGDTLPWRLAILVDTRSSTQIGRHTRGRFFLPAPEETFMNADVLTPAAATRVSAAVNAVKAAVTADGSTFYVVDTGKPNALPPITAGPKYVVDAWTVSNKPSSQEGRVRKIKPVYT